MASLLQKLLRKQLGHSIIASLNKHPPANLIPPLLTHPHQTHIAESEPHHQCIADIVPFKTGDSICPRAIPIFPIFPFGFLLNPIGSTGFAPAGADDAVSGDDRTIWADSVKKKRKRKMNKHKYRKLRKRLRRKT